MAAKLLSENTKFSLSKQLEGDSNPEGKAWDWLIESLAERAKTTTNAVLRLLEAKGNMAGGAPNLALTWRGLEMAIWVSVGVRLPNFRQLDWDARFAMLRATAREERVFDFRVGWLDVNQPFDLVGRPPLIEGIARTRMQARGGGDMELPAGKRLRRSA